MAEDSTVQFNRSALPPPPPPPPPPPLLRHPAPYCPDARAGRSDVNPGDWDVVVGAAWLTRATGKFYFEVEVCEAEGDLVVGLVGTNFQGKWVGADGLSWAIWSNNKTLSRQTKI